MKTFCIFYYEIGQLLIIYEIGQSGDWKATARITQTQTFLIGSYISFYICFVVY